MNQRNCKHCAAPLPTDARANRLYCGNPCRDRAKWSRTVRIPCVRCGTETGWRIGDLRAAGSGPVCRGCTATQKPGPPAPSCEFCHSVYEPKWNGRAWTRCCSRSCARKMELQTGDHPWMTGGWSPAKSRDERQARKYESGKRAQRVRRERLALVESEHYTLKSIAERDGFRCGICGDSVDMSLPFPDPQSASVDHIVPIAKGGDDTRRNVRLAHLGENMARGHRADDPQQMLLIG